MRIAMFQPDIPQNAGAVIRLSACLNIPVDIIEPCGFLLDDRRLKRVLMDYGARAEVERHASWQDWQAARKPFRILLLTTQGAVAYTDFHFQDTDILLLGRESAGVPAEIHAEADARLIIPIVSGARSLNVVTAAAIVIGEALRQTGGFDEVLK